MKPLYCFLVMLVALPSIAHAAEGGHPSDNRLGFSIDYGLTLDDNVTRAELDRDVFDDTYMTLEAVGRYTIPINRNSYAMLRATLGTHHYLDFDGLSNHRLGVDGSIFYKPVLRFTANEYFLRMRYENRAYDSSQRDGSANRISLGLNKRLTEILSMQLGFVSESIDAEQRTFDADNDRLYIDFEYTLSARQKLYARLTRSDGVIVATTIPTAAIVAASTSIVRDDAFLDVTPNRFAYKLDAESIALQIGDAITIDRYQGVDVSLMYYDTEATTTNEYSGLILSLFYRYSFL